MYNSERFQTELRLNQQVIHGKIMQAVGGIMPQNKDKE